MNPTPGIGFDSIDAFNETVIRLTGTTRRPAPGNAVTVTQLHSPLGPLLAGATPSGLCVLEFMDPATLQRQLKRLQEHLAAPLMPGDNPIFCPLRDQLRDYFNRRRKTFEIPLDPHGTPFQQRVWNQLQRIPYGETRSYTDQASALDALDALRAVARANGENPIAILIPCHRVIGKNGALTGYAGGLWRKEFLLHLEGAPEQLTLDGLG